MGGRAAAPASLRGSQTRTMQVVPTRGGVRVDMCLCLMVVQCRGRASAKLASPPAWPRLSMWRLSPWCRRGFGSGSCRAICNL
eukprot:143424-Pelagomonas_calceolata.AAC.1